MTIHDSFVFFAKTLSPKLYIKYLCLKAAKARNVLLPTATCSDTHLLDALKLL